MDNYSFVATETDLASFLGSNQLKDTVKMVCNYTHGLGRSLPIFYFLISIYPPISDITGTQTYFTLSHARRSRVHRGSCPLPLRITLLYLECPFHCAHLPCFAFEDALNVCPSHFLNTSYVTVQTRFVHQYIHLKAASDAEFLLSLLQL